MARNALGSLIVRLGLDAAEFTAGLTRGEFQAKKFSDNVNKHFGVIGEGLKGVIAGIAGGLTVGAFAGIIKDSIAASASLKDLSESTGVAVEKLSGLQEVARVGGKDFESVSGAFIKLAKSMSEAAGDPNSQAAQVFKNFGVQVTDAQGHLKNLGDFLPELAKRVDSFKTGTALTANTLVILGKSGADAVKYMIPYLKDLADAGDLVTTTTTEQAAAADEYEKNLKRLGLQKQELVRVITNALVPAANDFIKALLESQKQAGSTLDTFRQMSSDGSLQKWFQNLAINVAQAADILIDWGNAFKATIGLVEAGAKQIGGLAIQFDGLNRILKGDFSGGMAQVREGFDTMTKAGREWVKTLHAAADRPLLADRVRKQIALSTLDARDAVEGASFKTPKKDPKPPPAAGAGAKDDTARRILDAYLKDLDRSIKAEEDLLRDRERFLDAYYRDNDLSIADYYDTRRQVISDALSAEIALYNQEEAALRKFAATADPKDRIRAEEQIREVIDKRGKAEHDAAIASITLNMDQARAVREYKKAIDEVAFALQDLRGDSVGAGLARLRAQQEDARKKFSANGDTGAISQLDDILRLTEAQLRLNEATAAYGRVQTAIGIASQRIDLLQQTGAITEIDAINKRSQLARDYVQVLKAQADEAERQAQLLDAGPVRDEALLRVEQMRVAIEQLAAQTDVLAKKFNDVFAGAFSDALVEFATNAKSVKDIVKDMEKSIVQSISRIASQNISETLFGKDGPLSFIGKGFAGLFGGGKDAASGATGAAALTGAGSVLTTAGSLLATAAASLQAAATAMFASSAGSSVNGIANGLGGFFSSGGSGGVAGWTSGFDLGGFFAGGGNPPIGKASIVGENGPEWFIPRVPGTILPNGLSPGDMGGNSHIVINVPQGTSRASANQIAAEVARRQNSAARRNL